MPDPIEGSARRLAAVWFADIVGYTRLSASDENAAHHLVTVLQEVARVEVAAQGGRIVKFIGDAVLTDFHSTEAAVRAALALGERFEAACGGAAKLRIGVHVGDVLGTPDGDLYGDGINVASRVQGIAEPGHTWITKDVFSQLHARRDFRFSLVGERALKGIEGKLTIYSVRLGSAPATEIAREAVGTRSSNTDLPARLVSALEGRYTLVRELGKGGMATVYLADDVRHGRKVALKVLHPELATAVGADRFLGEIRTTANLRHPHILPLFDSGEANGFLFYVMPLVEGESLRDRLDRAHQLPIDDSVRIARAVASALEHAHRQGVVHRDIKPGNILFQDAEPIVADFGIARAISSAGEGGLTETGLSLGTPGYMSPEQAAGETDIDARSDIYALGCVLYEMLTGERPHLGRTAQAILAKALTENPRPVSTVRPRVPPHVVAAVGLALERLAADRFQTAGAFARALEAHAVEEEPAVASKARRASAAPPAGSSGRYARLFRVGLMYLVSAGVLLVLTGVLQNYLALADWVMPGGVLLLLVGFVVTLATEWVQSRPVPQHAGAQPGPLPWLTWSRALLGGVSAYTLLFVTAGLYELITNPGLTPEGAAAQLESSPPDNQQLGAAPPADSATLSDPAPAEPPTTAAAPPAQEPATPSNDASDAYEAARGHTETARRSAVTAGATNSLQAFARADTERSQAMTRADQGRFAEAAEGMNRARGLYDDARNGAILQERVDSIRGALGPLQSAARLTGADAAEVQQLRDQAEDAERAGRYQDAIGLLLQVADRYRSAAAARARADAAARQIPTVDTRLPAQPQPEPVTPPAAARASKEEIAAQVVEQIRLAIEAKSMDALQAVWPQITDAQVQGYRRSWAIMDNLRVRMETASVEESAGRITARVNVRYDYQNLTNARRLENQQSVQTFTIAEQGGRWIVVSSSGF